jgi:hypothetical protein
MPLYLFAGGLSTKNRRYYGEVIKSVVQTVNYIQAREFNNFLFQEFLNELPSSCGHVLRHSEVRWLSKRNVSYRLHEFPHEIKPLLIECAESCPEVDNFNIWPRLAFMIDVTGRLDAQSESKK